MRSIDRPAWTVLGPLIVGAGAAVTVIVLVDVAVVAQAKTVARRFPASRRWSRRR